MVRISVISATVIAVLISFSSCRMFSSMLHDEKVVARVGSELLYDSEVAELIPEGTSHEDSLRLAMQYIDMWAMDRIYLDVAEAQLSKSEKDVSEELEDYRRSLLKYKYEHIYINQRLDTLVTDKEIEDYYSEHSGDFKLKFPIVRARYMKIFRDSPDLAILKKKMSSFDDGDVWEADSLAYSSAVVFTTYSDRWIDLAVLAKDMDMDLASVLNVKPGAFLESYDLTGKLNVAYISEKMNAGEIPPVEYCTDMITDRLLSLRKHKLVTELERDLLEDARAKGKLVIY